MVQRSEGYCRFIAERRVPLRSWKKLQSNDGSLSKIDLFDGNPVIQSDPAAPEPACLAKK